MNPISKKVLFGFKESRNYVHGTQIFELVVDLFEGALLTDVRITMHEYIHTPACNLYVSDAAEGDFHPEQCGAVTSVCVDGEAVLVSVEADLSSDAPPTYVPYDESSIIDCCSFQGKEVSLLERSPCSPIETIVTMNKYLNKSLFPDADREGSWAFTRLDMPSLVDSADQMSLVFKHNFNLNLTKSEIRVSGQKVGEIYFSLVRS